MENLEHFIFLIGVSVDNLDPVLGADLSDLEHGIEDLKPLLVTGHIFKLVLKTLFELSSYGEVQEVDNPLDPF